MKKISKLLYASLILALCALVLLPAAAAAMDISRSVDYSIHCELDGVVLNGLHVDLFRVADVKSADPLEFALTGDFVTYPVEVNQTTDTGWTDLCTTLDGYAVADDLPPAYSGTTNSNGNVTFEDLDCGLYLVRFEKLEKGDWVYVGSPVLVCLPDWNQETASWNYVVKANGKFTASPIHLEDYVTRKVIKVWNDSGNESKRPASITINLYQDKVLYDTVELSESNNWCYEWKKLPANSVYEVSEKLVSGYKVSISKDGTAYTVKNTYITPDVPPTPPPKRPPTNPKLPQTGQMWWPVGLLGLSGLVSMMIGLKLRKVNEHD